MLSQLSHRSFISFINVSDSQAIILFGFADIILVDIIRGCLVRISMPEIRSIDSIHFLYDSSRKNKELTQISAYALEHYRLKLHSSGRREES